MKTQDSIVEEQVAEAVIAFQVLTTGHAPGSASVVLNDDTLVITLHDASTADRSRLQGLLDGYLMAATVTDPPSISSCST